MALLPRGYARKATSSTAGRSSGSLCSRADPGGCRELGIVSCKAKRISFGLVEVKRQDLEDSFR